MPYSLSIRSLKIVVASMITFAIVRTVASLCDRVYDCPQTSSRISLGKGEDACLRDCLSKIS